MSNWEFNAHTVEEDYEMFVDWEVRFYICPFCGESVYDCDWSEDDLDKFICPICEDNDL